MPPILKGMPCVESTVTIVITIVTSVYMKSHDLYITFNMYNVKVAKLHSCASQIIRTIQACSNN